MAPLTPEQTVDLYIGAFVNGDVSKAREFNDAVRASYGSKDALNVDVLSKMGDSMRKDMADGMLEPMPPKVSAALRPSVEGPSLRICVRSIARSARQPGRRSNRTRLARARRSRRSSLRAASRMQGPAEALAEKLGDGRRLKNDAARIVAFQKIFSGMAKVLDAAPVTYP